MFNQLRNSIRKYFGISTREANGVSALLIILIIVLLSPLVYNRFLINGYTNYRLDSLMLDSLIDIYEKKLKNIMTENQKIPIVPDTIFPFNPNTVSFKEMMLLGFDSAIGRRIMKYRDKNGQFIVKRDLLRIYDFPESLYLDLKDYIILPEEIPKKIPKKQYDKVQTQGWTGNISEKVSAPKMKFNINLADSNQLMILKGIGSILSNRIIKYRDLLGGYSNIDQLNDVYGLRGKALELLKSAVFVDSLFIPEKIEINFSGWTEMVRHPYINSQLANDIIKLRSDKGYLKSIDQLLEIPYLNDSILHRVEPYIKF
ncbi:MAG: helix-hairpin-helix domain-containing protein [Cyclobacteriaceae bacterium]|jgi:DNA uptake protein ComE-like DNA-binding protein